MISLYINEADEDLQKMKTDLASEKKKLMETQIELTSLTKVPANKEKASLLKDWAADNRDAISILKEQIEDFEKQKSILLQSLKTVKADLALAINHESMLWPFPFAH